MNAIVWQDRRTALICDALNTEGLEPMITHKTDLLLAPYVARPKVKWLLDCVEGAHLPSEAGELHIWHGGFLSDLKDDRRRISCL